MSDRQPIVIAGGGIGGLTAALALAAVGERVIVAERSPEISDVGAGIQIAPNAGRILADLGLEDAIAARAIEPDSIDFRSGPRGRLIASIPGAAFRTRYGLPYRVLHRADLQAVLVNAVRANPAIRFELGSIIAGLRPQADGVMVRVSLSGGVEGINAAAFISADGVRSTFREKIAGSGATIPSGRTAWRATIPVDAAPAFAAQRSVGVWLGRDAHVVHYPVGQGNGVNVVAIVEDAWSGAEWNAAGDPPALKARFSHWPDSVQQLLAVPTGWRKFAITSVDPAGRWNHGRIALVGDAAHAMVPFLAQGAAMAIEDAAVLAGSMAAATDVPAALAKYAALRRPRVQRVAAASERTGRRYHAGTLMAAGRNAALRLMGRQLVLNGNDWLYGWRPPSR